MLIKDPAGFQVNDHRRYPNKTQIPDTQMVYSSVQNSPPFAVLVHKWPQEKQVCHSHDDATPLSFKLQEAPGQKLIMQLHILQSIQLKIIYQCKSCLQSRNNKNWVFAHKSLVGNKRVYHSQYCKNCKDTFSIADPCPTCSASIEDIMELEQKTK